MVCYPVASTTNLQMNSESKENTIHWAHCPKQDLKGNILLLIYILHVQLNKEKSKTKKRIDKEGRNAQLRTKDEKDMDGSQMLQV